MADKQSNSTENISVKTFGHKYRWTGEEIAILIGLGVLIVGISVWGFIGDWFVPALIVSAAFLAIGVYAASLGFRRKRKSALTSVFNPETQRLAVGGNGHEMTRNHMGLGEIKNVGYKHLGDTTANRFSPRDLLLFHSKNESRNLQVPLRLLSDEDFDALVAPIIEAKGNSEAKEAAEFGRNYGG